MTDKEFIKKIKYGLIVIKESKDDDNCIDIVHFCGYHKKPTKKDVKALIKELKEDKEFGLVETIDDCEVIEAPKELVEFYKGKKMKWTQAI